MSFFSFDQREKIPDMVAPPTTNETWPRNEVSSCLLLQINSLVSIFVTSNHSGHWKCGWRSIRLYFRVEKAASFFFAANSPVKPALCNPKDRPPHPANKSMYISSPHFLHNIPSIFYQQLVRESNEIVLLIYSTKMNFQSPLIS